MSCARKARCDIAFRASWQSCGSWLWRGRGDGGTAPLRSPWWVSADHVRLVGSPKAAAPTLQIGVPLVGQRGLGPAGWITEGRLTHPTQCGAAKHRHPPNWPLDPPYRFISKPKSKPLVMKASLFRSPRSVMSGNV